jgi:hypothetical protein
MGTTNFSGPVTLGEQTGAPTTDTRGFVRAVRIVTLSQATSLVNISIPPKSVVMRLGFVPTSAFTGTDPVSAMNVTFRNGTIVHGIVTASADTKYHEVAIVSGAVYDTSAVMTVTLSALSTTVFTGGGGRAYVDILTTE